MNPTIQEILNIQARQLVEWKSVLKPKAYKELECRAKEETIVPPKQLHFLDFDDLYHNIPRGIDLDGIVSKLMKGAPNWD